jgi:hypothetical protein
MQQRYVSKELTHFVAASLRPNEEAQYSLFRAILRSGMLRNPSFGNGFGYALSPVANDLGESLSAPVVCFCDIPVEDLQLHSTKYGRFGIAFRKEDLVRKGATPVFYVVKDAPSLPVLNHMFSYDRPLTERGQWSPPVAAVFRPRARYDLFELWKYASLRMSLQASSGEPQTSTYEFMQGPWWSDYQEFFSLYMFGYVKYMDVGLPEDDPRNFYMEREWRVLNGVSFQLDDVARILIPEAFARTFRADFPEYFGQLSFVE